MVGIEREKGREGELFFYLDSLLYFDLSYSLLYDSKKIVSLRSNSNSKRGEGEFDPFSWSYIFGV